MRVASDRASERGLVSSLFCTYLGSAGTATAVTIFLVQEFGVGSATGLAMILYLLPNLVLGPMAGEFVSRVNAKVAAALGSLAAAVTVLGYLLVQAPWQAQILSLLIGFTGLIGIPARMALRANVFSPDRVHATTGKIVAAERLGLVIGPLLASSISFVFDVRAAFLLEVVLCILAIILLLPLQQRPLEKAVPTRGIRAIYQRAWHVMARDRVVLEYSVTGFTYSVGTGIRRLLFPAVLVVSLNSSNDLLGVFISVMAFGGILGGFLATRISSHLLDRHYLIQSGVEVLLWLLLVFVTDIWAYIGILLIAGVLEGSTTALYLVKVQEHIEPKDIGRYFSLMSPLTDASIGLGVMAASIMGASVLADNGSWIIAILIGIPFIFCRGIVSAALRPVFLREGQG